jgi:DeoR/GlpR family transcriptional regulator of sugar metabolism
MKNSKYLAFNQSLAYDRSAMDLESRHEIVLDLLHERGEVTVAQLTERTGVSAVTIRRDLEMLENDGALQRVHGGAISVASRGFGAPYSVRAKRNVEIKQKIGQAAAALVRERETVIIDVGTTTFEVARALQRRRNLTVITPSLQVAYLLSKNRELRLIVSGGTVVPGERSLVGDMVADFFSRLRCDTFVMGVGGIDVDAGCTDFSLEDAAVKRAALACAQRCIVVADSSKLGRISLAKVCPLERVDVLVTDSAAAQDDLLGFDSAQTEVMVV